MSQDSNKPFVLTVAGSDTSCGAGVQSDIVTIKHFGASPLCAVTAITSQTQDRVFDVTHAPSDLLGKQLSAAAASGKIAAVKIGMLGSASNVRELVLFLKGLKCPHVVLDPVLKSSGDVDLLEVSAHSVFKDKLMPLATLVTPNAVEAGLLTGMNVWNVPTAKDAAKIIWGDVIARRQMDGVAVPSDAESFHVLIKGGHLKGGSVDVLFDGKDFVEFEAARITSSDGGNVSRHGTGCRLSSAIAANLAMGKNIADAVCEAKKFVADYLSGR